MGRGSRASHSPINLSFCSAQWPPEGPLTDLFDKLCWMNKEVMSPQQHS